MGNRYGGASRVRGIDIYISPVTPSRFSPPSLPRLSPIGGPNRAALTLRPPGDKVRMSDATTSTRIGSYERKLGAADVVVVAPNLR